MLRFRKPRFASCFQISQWLFHCVAFNLSSFPSFSDTHLPIHQENRKEQQQKKKMLLAFLHKHPTNYKTAQQVHSHLLVSGLMYHSMILFNALIRCYSFSDNPKDAFLLYKQLQKLYFQYPFVVRSSFDSFTYAFLIKTSANLCYPVLGMQIHGLTVKLGFECHVYVQTALVNVYAKCGVLEDAKKVFCEMPERNSVTWNVIITGLVKWGELEQARSLFEEMPNRSVVSWTGIIDGYTRMNRPGEALALFRRMVENNGIEPSGLTILAILPAVYNIGDVRICQLVHGYGEKKGFHVFDIRVANSLIDTYAKCGSIFNASKFFEEISTERRNLVSWTSIISGFAMHGMGKEAIENFERMEKEGWKPNRVTFLSVLNACSHGGLVQEGLKFFGKMVDECQILPDIKHYGCLVDMLGRAGKLKEAEMVALKIPSEMANVVVWRTLLGACSFHGNVEVGERVTRKIMEIEGGYGGDYVLMSNILAGAGMHGDSERLRRLMDERSALKLPGYSLV
ncbi:hypothetical protein SLA2020_324990 [Shorea laevis]